jgi:putative drug exporter of the RND superfamily
VHVDASADAAVPPAPAAPPVREEIPLQSVQKTVEAAVGASPAKPRSEVEVIPGRHLVASVNGTIIVVAHRDRAPLSQNSIAAQQLAALVDMVRRTDAQTLVEAFKKIAREPWSHTMVDVGIVMPTQASLEILLCGSVTVALDNGIDRTLLHGRGRLVHRSVSVPAVAAVITVDELGQRTGSPVDGGGVYKLTEGTVPGEGAVMWSTQAAPAPRSAPVSPSNWPPSARSDRMSGAPMAPLSRPKRWVVLDDNSRFEIDRDCVIGRDPNGSEAVKRGLAPICIEDHAGAMSRAHAEVRIINADLVIVDPNSTNGVFLREPTQLGWTKLTPWEPATWRPGAYVQLGGRILRLHVGTEQHDASQRPYPDHTYAPAIGR